MNNYPVFPLLSNSAHPHHTCSQNFTNGYTYGITPRMLRSAYFFSLPKTDTFPSIAVISAFDNPEIVESMECFCNEFSLDIPEMEIHYPFGKASFSVRRWTIESCLDTQWAHVFSPFSKIHAVFSRDDNIENLLDCAVFASTELKADVICMCFGLREQQNFSKYSKSFDDLKAVFLSSSGDAGGVVSFPSTLAHCISVGGVNLDITKDSTRKAEQTAWSFGGGGKSSLFEIPSFQEKFSPINQMSEGKRATPDLSFFADGKEKCAVCTSGNGLFATVGGTSLSCACVSGICALIKSAHPELDTSNKMLTFLYEKAGLTQYTLPQYNFDDITIGKSGMFFAKEGWDFCTGLGTPVIKQLIM